VPSFTKFSLVLVLLLGKETAETTKLSHIIKVNRPHVSFPLLFTFVNRVVQPIPLECLRLASFNDGPEEVQPVQQPKPGFFRGMLSCCSSLPPEPMYPFTIYHAAAKIIRRHTLYTLTATERNRWRTALDDAIEARKSKQKKPVLLLQFDFYAFLQSNVVIRNPNAQ
jgi:hypothetical protein